MVEKALLIHSFKTQISLYNTTKLLILSDVQLQRKKIHISEKTCLIELAQASGLHLLTPNEQSPLHTSTYGTGLQIKQAFENNYREVILTLGGSATNDGGAGILEALGFKFYNIKGNELHITGKNLNQIFEITPPQEFIKGSITLASDVNNILLGDTGATCVYARQKGAKEEDIIHLEKGMEHLSFLLKKQTGFSFSETNGAGAGGGASYGLMHFYPFRRTSGFNLISELLDIPNLISNSDLIITGEGKTDEQTLNGKLIDSLSQIVKTHQKQMIVISGQIDNSVDYTTLYKNGCISMHSLVSNHKEYLREKDKTLSKLTHTTKSILESLFNKT